MTVIKGCDISDAQGKVNFSWLAQNDYKFVISECGIGNDGFSHYYQSNIAATKANGMKAACYHFLYPLPDNIAHPNRNPVDQANLHFAASNGELALADIEYPAPQDWNKWGCSASQINDWLCAYLERYEVLSGQFLPVYTYPWFAKAVSFNSEVGNHPLWIASYSTSPTIPSPWQNYLIWQSGQEKLDTGVLVDVDWMNDLNCLWND